jgi:hypothetical protein
MELIILPLLCLFFFWILACVCYFPIIHALTKSGLKQSISTAMALPASTILLSAFLLVVPAKIFSPVTFGFSEHIASVIGGLLGFTYAQLTLKAVESKDFWRLFGPNFLLADLGFALLNWTLRAVLSPLS